MTTEITGDGGHLVYKSGIYAEGHLPRRPRPELGTVAEPARDVRVFRDCDVLVVGGGPSGTAAAIAAARPGADVVLLERYNHLGGLSTGGLVIWIDRMTDWSGQQVIRGIANDLMDRLPKDAVAGPPRDDWGSQGRGHRRLLEGAHGRLSRHRHLVADHRPRAPEAVSQEMVLETKVRLLLPRLGCRADDATARSRA